MSASGGGGCLLSHVVSGSASLLRVKPALWKGLEGCCGPWRALCVCKGMGETKAMLGKETGILENIQIVPGSSY